MSTPPKQNRRFSSSLLRNLASSLNTVKSFAMAHDPRVSQTLARLGGVYRDPWRVDRDASALLRSSVGAYLVPIIADHFEDDGTEALVLDLKGTIATHYRGNTYHILVEMFLAPGYPGRPPICFVRLAENMFFKENHMHVGSDGKVYLPYLHEWSSHTHNLIELVVAMSSVFSADPPVFTRAPTEGPNRPNDPPLPLFSPTTSTVSTSSTASHQSHDYHLQRMQQEQRMQEQLLVEQRLAELRIAEQRVAEEEARERQLQAQREWEERRTQQVRQDVAKKITSHIQDLSQQCQQELQNDWKDQQNLTYSAEHKIEPQIELYKKSINDMEKSMKEVDRSISEIQVWLQQAEEHKEEDAHIPVDDLVQPAHRHHEQMLNLSAENAAISDALYFLDRALYQGNLTLETHLRHVRRLSKRQFLVRAHLLKISQTFMVISR
ncbi:ESCRT-I complex subunit TSG101 [Fistulifera solaris]|uniref:ESCRT-I complex subunit TSG101 n=1 Tax=Fistulifera solaris TaxID=1519565 RepID=A0A1Z5KDP9_FISSO|nr:ESCRT-I complex subunit TSG101 [Fistulifera solaris]|eukprot:GAX24265.1 ESCRT-I complex subunit TSG101 [Fistulifera solaris]